MSRRKSLTGWSVFSRRPGARSSGVERLEGRTLFAAGPDGHGVLAATGPASVDEGSAYTVTFGAEPVDAAIAGWQVDFGDGSGPQPLSADATSATHTYADDGAHTVSVHAVYDDGSLRPAGALGGPSVGQLDPSYGDRGVALAGPWPGGGALLNVVAHPGGGFVAADERPEGGVVVARFAADGTPDPSFGLGGSAAIDSPPGASVTHFHAVAVDAQGRVVVQGSHAGRHGQPEYFREFFLARFLPNGAPDPEFGAGGVARHPVLGPGAYGRDIAFGPDGTIVAAGGGYLGEDNAGRDFFVARFDDAGALDTGFGDGGSVYLDFGPLVEAGGAVPDRDEAAALALLPDGGVLVGGNADRQFPNFGTNAYGFALARLDADGDLVTGFGTGGQILTHLTHGGSLTDLSLDSAGRVVVAGTVLGLDGGGAPVGNFAVARYTAAGAPDPSFGTGGITITDFGRGLGDDLANSLEVLPGGQILVAGESYPHRDFDPDDPFDDLGSDFALARYDADGNLDPTFGAGGLVRTAVTPGPSSAKALAPQADGSLLAAGLDFDTLSFATARYLPGPAPLTVTVKNVAPAVTLGGGASGVRLQSLDFAGTFTDPGADTWSGTVNYGDGTGDQPLVVTTSPTGKSFAAPAHVYAATGDFTVTVRLNDGDGDGGIGVATHAVRVEVAQLQADPGDPSKSALFVGGTGGNDPVTIESAGRGGSVAVTVGGAAQGTFSPTGRVVILTGAGNDTVNVGGSVGVLTEIHAGDGHDALNAGNGGSIVVGGRGNDSIHGGSGRDLLIGGTGGDRIVANPGDDILIAGRTAHDADPRALYALWREWNRTDQTYAQRIEHLQGNSATANPAAGLNGTYYLRATGTGRTVFDDTSNDEFAYDTLNGASGDDWFFANVSNGGTIDKLSGNTKGETQTDTAV